MKPGWISVAARRPHRSALTWAIVAACVAVATVHAQAPGASPTLDSARSDAPVQVDVRPGANDEAIQKRLSRILTSTGWFEAPGVSVREGVVFLEGVAESEPRRRWAGDLARNTEDVVAVVNRMAIASRYIWDMGPAITGLRDLLARIVSTLPGVVFAILVLGATWIIAKVVRSLVEWLAARHVRAPLLQRVIARAAAVVVLLLGTYVVLYVSGLTRLAVTVLGGTGLIGLVVGVAFRDITENFLASVFLSVQQPFRMDDLIEVAGVTGLVQRTTFRTTVLLTLDGNHVQVPNSTVYKSVIRNFTSNPSRREQFDVGIGYEVAISRAQEVAREVLKQHPAVLADPEPWVLVSDLGSATVVLRVYFWLDGTQHSWLKVRSSVIRLVKRAFQEAGIDMPDEAREIVFPTGVPVTMFSEDPAAQVRLPAASQAASEESSAIATPAEHDLCAESEGLKRQTREGRSPEEGENLLKS